MQYDGLTERLLKRSIRFLYRVTIQVDSSLPLIINKMFCFSLWPMYKNDTFVLVST